jgi:hypothetical protein
MEQITSHDLKDSTIKDIAALVRDSAKPGWLRNPVNGDCVLVTAHGEINHDATVRAPLHLKADSLGGLGDAFTAIAGPAYKPISAASALLCIGESQIRAELNDTSNETVGMVTLNKSPSACMCWLLSRAPHKAPTYDSQKTLIRSLRTLFPDRHNKQFATDLSQLKFKSDGEVTSGVHHGRESVQKSVEQKVAGLAAELPDEITLHTTVNDLMPSLDIEWSHPVECVLHINMEEGTFAVIPKAGQIEAAQIAANKLIEQYLTERLFDFAAEDSLGLRVVGDCSFA